MKPTNHYTKRGSTGTKHGYRSNFEFEIGLSLIRAGVSFEYESEKIPYTKPATIHNYLPDFIITKSDGNKMYIEGKGRFLSADRQKHRLIKKQHPKLDIRFLFMNPNQKLSKSSKTTYAMWCDKYGFKYARGCAIPTRWLEE